MKVVIMSLSVFLVLGCTKNPSYYKLNNTIEIGDNITHDVHEQGYYNCINSGASKGYCSRLHNYKR